MTNIINFDTIKGLIYTEKSNKLTAEKKYQFLVDKDCTKNQVASLIKKLYGVDVIKVNTINSFGKLKRFKGVIGTRSNYKKITVTIKKEQTINIAS